MAKVDIGGTIVQIGDDRYIPTEDEVRQVAIQAGIVTEEQSIANEQTLAGQSGPQAQTNKYSGLSPLDAMGRFGKDIASSISAVPQALQPAPTGRIVPDVLAGMGAGTMGAFGPAYEFANQLKNRAIIGNVVSKERNPNLYELSTQLTDPRNYALTMVPTTDPFPIKSAENAIKSTMRTAIKPTKSGVGGGKAMADFDSKATDAVKAIVSLSEDGQLPASRQGFFDSIRATKDKIWDILSKQTDAASYYKATSKTDLSGLVAELKRIRNSDLFSQPEYASALKQLDEKISFYESNRFNTNFMRERIGTLNSKNRKLYNAVDATQDFIKPIELMETNYLNKISDGIIERLTGKGTQELRRYYGALKTIEKDVEKSIFKGDSSSLTDTLLDVSSADDVIKFLTSGNYGNLKSAVMKKLLNGAIDVFRAPDNRIASMFKKATILKDKSAFEFKPTQISGLLEAPKPQPEIRPQSTKLLPGPETSPNFVLQTQGQAVAAQRALIDDIKRRIGSGQNPRFLEQRHPDAFNTAMQELESESRTALLSGRNAMDASRRKKSGLPPFNNPGQ